MSFSERLRQIAEKDFRTQVGLADALGITKVAVNNYTSGKRKPSYDVLTKLNMLGYSVDWLISEQGSMKNSTAVGRNVRFQFIFEDNQMITSCLDDYEDAELIAFADRIKAGKDKNLKHVLEYKDGEFVKILSTREE